MVDSKEPQRAGNKQAAAQQAAAQNEAGLEHFSNWNLAEAVAAFQEATRQAPDNPEYHLNLARAYARSGEYHEAMGSLGEYLRTETDEVVASRYERLFSSALDPVEERLIETMGEMELPLQYIAKAIQMWLEYRITIGRRPLRTPKPELWSAALTYAVCKINLEEVTRQEVAEAYEISERALKEKYQEVVSTLDLMPADFRYFVGEENPLDKLVEAAQLLDDMYGRFND